MIVCLTTAPRREPTSQQTLKSLRQAGFDHIVAFAEPGSETLDCLTVWNANKLGVWHNWTQSCRWALENTCHDIIVTVQDDAAFHPGSRQFLEAIAWPSKKTAFVSLYTPQHYSMKRGHPRTPGVNKIATYSLWGAVALAWPRKVLARVLEHPIAREWIGAGPRRSVDRPGWIEKRTKQPHLVQNSDTAIGKVVNAMRLEMYFVDPSLVTHTAKYSAIGHGDNSGRRNAGRIAPHDRLIEIPLPSIQWMI